MKKARVAKIAAGVISCSGAVAALVSPSATADRPAFAPVPVVGNLAALSAPALATTPSRVNQLPSDTLPAGAAVRPLGDVGFVWLSPGVGVCVLMDTGAGGCGEQFDKPVILFLTGRKSVDRTVWTAPHQVRGFVPNYVKNVVLVLSTGERVPAELSRNGIRASIPAGSEIVAEEVTLAGGRSLVFQDRVRLASR